MGELIPAPVKPGVTTVALDALDIRVGTIERVEEVPRSEKLMKLTVNFGDHTRTILAGIRKERQNPVKSKAARLSSSSTWSREKWPAKFPRACSLTSAMPTA